MGAGRPRGETRKARARTARPAPARPSGVSRSRTRKTGESTTSPRRARGARPSATRPGADPSAAWHPAYSVHPGLARHQDWVRGLVSKTGRSLAEWLTLISRKSPVRAGRAQAEPGSGTQRALRDWLMAEFDLNQSTAWYLAERSVGKGGEEDSAEGYVVRAAEYVDAMYAGPRAGLRPLHDAMIRAAIELGGVKICPCKTIVPLYRKHVFAQIKPASRTRIDLGLCLRGYEKKLPARVISTGGAQKGDRITHRIEITSVSDLDPEALRWLRIAHALSEPT